MYNDRYSATGEDIYDNLDFHSIERWKDEPPNHCKNCSSDDIIGVEILGAFDGPLFWECAKCGERYLRFTRAKTIAHLDKTVNLYIDLEGLLNIWEQIPN